MVASRQPPWAYSINLVLFPRLKFKFILRFKLQLLLLFESTLSCISHVNLTYVCALLIYPPPEERRYRALDIRHHIYTHTHTHPTISKSFPNISFDRHPENFKSTFIKVFECWIYSVYVLLLGGKLLRKWRCCGGMSGEAAEHPMKVWAFHICVSR